MTDYAPVHDRPLRRDVRARAAARAEPEMDVPDAVRPYVDSWMSCVYPWGDTVLELAMHALADGVDDLDPVTGRSLSPASLDFSSTAQCVTVVVQSAHTKTVASRAASAAAAAPPPPPFVAPRAPHRRLQPAPSGPPATDAVSWFDLPRATK